jgi:hypothetical protein
VSDLTEWYLSRLQYYDVQTLEYRYKNKNKNKNKNLHCPIEEQSHYSVSLFFIYLYIVCDKYLILYIIIYYIIVRKCNYQMGCVRSTVPWCFSRFTTCYGIQGRIQDFKLGGAHLKKLRRAEGGAKFVGVFRVKNHDFTPKNHIFPILGGGARNFWGISCEKSRFYAKKKSYFYQF